jgi:type III secretion protein L
MGNLTFLNNKNFSLSSNDLVYQPDEVNSLNSILQQASALHQLIADEESNIAAATQAGYDAGYEKGQAEGYEAALEHIATKLVVLAKEANASRDDLRHSAGDIAIKIVAKIATDLGSQPTIAALVKTAAKDIAPHEPIVLKVSPDNVGYMTEEIKNSENYSGVSERIVDVVADPGMGSEDCVLETEYGHIRADLKTQLKVLRDNFYRD